MGNRHTSFIRVLIALFYALFAFQAVAQSDRTVAEDSKAFVYEVEPVSLYTSDAADE